MIISSRQKLLSLNDYTINNDIDSVQVNQTTHSKSLGLNIDDLSWKALKQTPQAFVRLRWLDTVFQGQYLPSLSINYVAINKVLEKLPPQLY